MTNQAIAYRRLVPGDEPMLDAFLATTPETTIFLRSNLARAGLVDDGSPFTGTYAGAFEDGNLAGVSAIYWNTNIVVGPGRHAEEATKLAVALAGRSIGGILGPPDEVTRVRAALGLALRKTRVSSHEILYALPLEDLVVPAPLADGTVVVRAPRADELSLLMEWRMQYSSETSNIADTPETRASQGVHLAAYQEGGLHFVATVADERVAYSAFNATVADIVQVGGVWTPPSLRGRGYARCAVAGSLQDARNRGVRRAVLFTGEDNIAAQKAYVALGFRAIGAYAIVFFVAEST